MNDGYVKNGSGGYQRLPQVLLHHHRRGIPSAPPSRRPAARPASPPPRRPPSPSAKRSTTPPAAATIRPRPPWGNAVQLYKGSVTAANLVSCSASLGNSSRTVTLTPAAALSNSTVYYLVLNSGYFKNSAGYVNAAQQIAFTTEGAQGHRHEHRRLRGGLHLRGGELYLHRCGQQCHGHPGDSGPDPERDGGRQHHRRLHRAGARRQLRRHHLRARGRRDLQGLQRPGLHQDPPPSM
jgi:hypothetical protein